MFLLILAASISTGMSAQTCCSGGVPLSSNLGLPNEGEGSLQLSLNYDYNNLRTLYAGRQELQDDSRKRVTNSALLALAYALSDRFAVETLFSWVHQTRTINQFENRNFSETKGVGDAVVLLKYNWESWLGIGSAVSIGAGVKMPLGSSDLESDQGIQLTADLQPGSGSWDGIGWLSVSKSMSFRPSATVSGSLIYQATGKNGKYLNETSTYEFGDVVQAQLGFTDQFLVYNALVRPGLLLKYRNAGRDKINFLEVPNTGGSWLFLRPSLQFPLSPKLQLSTRVEIPVYSFVRGTQLTPTLRLSAGIAYNIQLKKNDNLLNTLR